MAIIVILLVLYFLFDVNYFIRMIITVSCGRFLQKRRKVNDKATLYGICTTQDIDMFISHMNNARYLRELDFARFHFYAVTGIYDEVGKVGGSGVQGATTVRYRRAIPIFHPYKIDTRLICWDDKTVYMEHQFITLSDNFVRSIVISKQCLLNCNPNEIMKNFPEVTAAPPMPEELRLWLEANDISSQKLRKDK